MPRCNKTRFAILGWLSKDAMSGYDMKQLATRVSHFYWSESNAQIYPILKQLEGEGLVVSHIDEGSGARNRRLYTITKAGKNVLLDWLRLPVEMPKYREEMMLKVGLGQHLKTADFIQQLNDYKLQLGLLKQHLPEILSHIQKDHVGKPDQPFLMLSYRFSELNLEAKLRWCDEAIAAMAP